MDASQRGRWACLLAEPVTGRVVHDLQGHGDEDVRSLLHHVHPADVVGVAGAVVVAAVVARVADAVHIGVRRLRPRDDELGRVRLVAVDPRDRLRHVPAMPRIPGHGIDRAIGRVDLRAEIREADLHHDDVARRVDVPVAVNVEVVVHPGRLDSAGVNRVVEVVAVAERGVRVVRGIPVPILVLHREQRRLGGHDHHPASVLSVVLHGDGRSRLVPRNTGDRDRRPCGVQERECRRIAALVSPVRALRRVRTSRRVRGDAVVDDRVLGDAHVHLRPGARHCPVGVLSPLNRRVTRSREREDVDRVAAARRRHVEDVQRDLLWPRDRAG